MTGPDYELNARTLRELPDRTLAEREGQVAIVNDGQVIGYWPTFKQALNAVPSALRGRCSVQTVRRTPVFVGYL